MALAGLKKQFNKANQFMSEKIGGVEGTKFTDEFTQLERKTDMTNELVDELINKTKEYLQPNPASRTKLMVSSKLKGAPGKPHMYPQPEGVLGEIMCKYGKELGEESNFARSLIEMGEAMKELSEVKYSLEDNVKQNFLEPLTHLQAKDLKDVMFHRKKLESRRLDFDCKKRKATKGSQQEVEEIRMAEAKFEESFNLASMGMHNLLQNEIEQLSQICVLAEALYEYHSQCANVLESLNARMLEIKNEAATRTFQPYVPQKLADLNLIIPSMGGHDDLSPGDLHNMNGLGAQQQQFPTSSSSTSHFFTTPSSSSTSNHYSSSQSLSSGSFGGGHHQRTAPPKPPTGSGFPPLTTKSSSPSWSTKSAHLAASSNPNSRFGGGPSSTHNGHHPNGAGGGGGINLSSTTAYLLSGKTSNSSSGASKPQQQQFSSPFSKSVTNLSSSASYPSFDLLGSIEQPSTSNSTVDPVSASWDDPPPSYMNSATAATAAGNRHSAYGNFSSGGGSSQFSPSGEHPAKPTHLFLDASKANNLNARTPTEARGPCASALYDFDPENENELQFKEGDLIQLLSQVDDNWYEGAVGGRKGLFPVSYVQVLVPVPKTG